jgi:hypothetical protein
MKYLKYILGGIITYYFSAIIGNKLYFLEIFLNQNTIDAILKNNWKLFLSLIIIYTMLLVMEDLYDYKKRT